MILRSLHGPARNAIVVDLRCAQCSVSSMEVFLQFEDRPEVQLNDTVAWHIPRKGELVEYEPKQGLAAERYEVVDVINRVDFRGILSRVQVVLRRPR